MSHLILKFFYVYFKQNNRCAFRERGKTRRLHVILFIVLINKGFCLHDSCGEDEMEKYGIHLLVLSHVYMVPKLKQKCTRALSERLTVDNVVDVLQLARLCDAPDLYLRCMKLACTSFKAVENTEGWKFVQNHDPWLELEILRFIDEAESV